jgi:hypothetical protein
MSYSNVKRAVHLWTQTGHRNKVPMDRHIEFRNTAKNFGLLSFKFHICRYAKALYLRISNGKFRLYICIKH